MCGLGTTAIILIRMKLIHMNGRENIAQLIKAIQSSNKDLAFIYNCHGILSEGHLPASLLFQSEGIVKISGFLFGYFGFGFQFLDFDKDLILPWQFFSLS